MNAESATVDSESGKPIPGVGELILAINDEPQTTRSWAPAPARPIQGRSTARPCTAGAPREIGSPHGHTWCLGRSTGRGVTVEYEGERHEVAGDDGGYWALIRETSDEHGDSSPCLVE